MSSRKKKMELSILNEAFRILKSNILFCCKDNEIKTITITSCNTREGKTTVALNLAISLAASDIKTLFIDSEFRRKKNLPEERNARYNLDNYIEDTSVNNLKYLSIASSISNPEAFIDTARLKTTIDRLSKQFDMIIIDAPPLGGVIDSAIIAANTDATIFVIQSRRHDYRAVLKMKEQFEMANVKILGVVISKADKSSYKSYFNYQKYCMKAKEMLELEQLKIEKQNAVYEKV